MDLGETNYLSNLKTREWENIFSWPFMFRLLKKLQHNPSTTSWCLSFIKQEGCRTILNWSNACATRRSPLKGFPRKMRVSILEEPDYLLLLESQQGKPFLMYFSRTSKLNI